MKWFKSLWFNMRKTNNLPGNEVLIPMKETPPIAEKQNDTTTKQAPAKKRGRKKKEVQNEIAPTDIA